MAFGNGTSLLRNSILLFCYPVSTVLSWDVRNHFASKTPYEFRKTLGLDEAEEDQQSIDGSLCIDMFLTLVGRHGTRYPTENTFRKLQDLKVGLVCPL